MSLLTLLQHSDSAFPSDAFAFSNGIEGLAGIGVNETAVGRRAIFALAIACLPGGTAEATSRSCFEDHSPVLSSSEGEDAAASYGVVPGSQVFGRREDEH